MLYHRFDFGFKLVTDGVVTDSLAQGCIMQLRCLQGDVRLLALGLKAEEELAEAEKAATRAEKVKELGDVNLVRLTLMEHEYHAHAILLQIRLVLKNNMEEHGITQLEIEAAMREKIRKKGNFSMGYAIGIIDVPTGNPYLPAFLADGVKYPYLGEFTH